MKTYSANEVVERVDRLNSVSTFNQWVNFIQKNCHYTFQKEMVPFQSYRGNKPITNHKESRFFTEEELSKFQQAPQLIQQVGREQALRELFDTKFQFEQLSHHELLERLEGHFEKNFEEQKNEIHKLHRQFATLQSELKSLKIEIEQLNDDDGKSTSGWFRRKR